MENAAVVGGAGSSSSGRVDPERDLAKVADAIDDVEQAIKQVEEEIKSVKEALEKGDGYLRMDVPELKGHLVRLMEEKKLRMEEKKQLREKDKLLMEEKQLRKETSKLTDRQQPVLHGALLAILASLYVTRARRLLVVRQRLLSDARYFLPCDAPTKLATK
jgi:chromosome segregation ATPase